MVHLANLDPDLGIATSPGEFSVVNPHGSGQIGLLQFESMVTVYCIHKTCDMRSACILMFSLSVCCYLQPFPLLESNVFFASKHVSFLAISSLKWVRLWVAHFG